MSDEHESNTVRVSMRDIYAEVQRQGKLLERVANSLPESQDKIDDHEQRLRKLETRMGWAIGGFGLIASVMPWIVGVVV